MEEAPKILIVDDDAPGRKALESLLLGQGYTLQLAGDGVDALAQAARVTPDLVLLDVMMPGMDGYEVCRRLRADPVLAEVPVVMVTALDDLESRLRGLESGADDFVSKPFERSELRARVRSITRLNRYRALLGEREKHREFSRHVLEVQEAERRRLAIELHDEIGQALTAVKLHVQALQNALPAGEHKFACADSLAVIDQALKQVRNLSLDLRPSLLDDLGLVPCVRWYVHRLTQKASPRFRVSTEGDETRLPVDMETACFRVVQEALTNALRHGSAKHVDVIVQQNSGTVEVSVRDDGVGFDVAAALSQAARGASLGLMGMQERARLVGSRLEITSEPGKGTYIRMRCSMPSAAPGAGPRRDVTAGEWGG